MATLASPAKKAKPKLPQHQIPLNLRGKVLGELVVIRRTGIFKTPSGSKKILWWVRCSCGKEFEVRHDYLIHKNSPKRSCGHDSSRAEKSLAALNPAEHRVWVMMWQRCCNPSHVSFGRYGGRGIHPDPRWLEFSVFLEEMGPRPNGTQIERGDPNRGYSKGNCKWVPKREQAWNKVNTIYLDDPENPGKKIAAGQLAHRQGVKFQTLRQRYIEQGKWPTSQPQSNTPSLSPPQDSSAKITTS